MSPPMAKFNINSKEYYESNTTILLGMVMIVRIHTIWIGRIFGTLAVFPYQRIRRSQRRKMKRRREIEQIDKIVVFQVS